MPVRLERLKVTRYRHLSEPADLEFGEGPVLVIGRNGTGKTNLLVLVDAVTRLDFRELEQDRAPLDIEFTLSVAALRLTLALQIDPMNGVHREERWRYRGHFRDGSHHVPFDSAGAAAKRPPSPLWPDFRASLAWFVSEGDARIEPWLEPMWGVAPTIPRGASRLDEATSLFESVTSPTDARVELTFGEGDDGIGVDSAAPPVLVPASVTSVLRGRAVGERQAEIRAVELPWLRQTAAAAAFAEIAVQPRLRGETPDGRTVWRTYAPFAFLGTLPDGKRISHVDFSFGQKRIVAFFWYLQCVRDAGSVVIADELVNGLHHEAVQVVVDGLAGLQAFLAGQDPLLFDFMQYSTPADFRTRIVHCDWGDRGWKWRNPTDEEARRFMASYDIGHQHVNEILQTEGLW